MKIKKVCKLFSVLLLTAVMLINVVGATAFADTTYDYNPDGSGSKTVSVTIDIEEGDELNGVVTHEEKSDTVYWDKYGNEYREVQKSEGETVTTTTEISEETAENILMDESTDVKDGDPTFEEEKGSKVPDPSVSTSNSHTETITILPEDIPEVNIVLHPGEKNVISTSTVDKDALLEYIGDIPESKEGSVITPVKDNSGNIIGWTETTVEVSSSDPVVGEEVVKSSTSTDVDTTEASGLKESSVTDEPIVQILLPVRPTEVNTKDPDTGDTMKVQVEDVYSSDGSQIVGYRVRTVKTTNDGNTVDDNTEMIWGTVRTTVVTTVTDPTEITNTLVQNIEQVSTFVITEGTTVDGVKIVATEREIRASMGKVTGKVTYTEVSTIKPVIKNKMNNKTDADTDLFNRISYENKSYNKKGADLQWLGEYGIESAFRVYTPATGSHGMVETWQPHQFVLQDHAGNKYYVYCTDFDVDPVSGAGYDMELLENTDIYNTFKGAEDHVRAIVLNGYWGTKSGTEGSLSVFRESLVNAGVLTKAEAAKLTDGMALTATQAAIWHYGNSGSSGSPKVTGKDVVGKYNDSTTYKTPDKADEALINKVYAYLITLSQKATSENTLFDENTFAKEVSLNVKNPTETVDGKPVEYDTDLSFTLALSVVQSTLNDSMIVSVIDTSTNEVLASAYLNGKAADGKKATTNLTKKNDTFTFNDLKLPNGVDLNLNLSGTQNLEQGVYLFQAVGGYSASQTFIGIGNVKEDIDLNVNIKFDVTDPVTADITTSQSYSETHQLVSDTNTWTRTTTKKTVTADITATTVCTDVDTYQWNDTLTVNVGFLDEPLPPTLPSTGLDWISPLLLAEVGLLLIAYGLTRKKNEA